MKLLLAALSLCLTLLFPCNSESIGIDLTEMHIKEGNFYVKMHEPRRTSMPIKSDFGTVTSYTYTSIFLPFDISLSATFVDWTAYSAAQTKKYNLRLSGNKDLITSHEASLRFMMEKKFGVLEKIYDRKVSKNENRQESVLAFRFRCNNQEYFFASYKIVIDIDKEYQLDYIANKSNMNLIDCKEWFDSFKLAKK